MDTSGLPAGNAPAALTLEHFPSRFHAFVWRNWSLVPVERMAAATETTAREVAAVARAMGLPKQPKISDAQQWRSHISVIKRNWQLLPYDRLLQLLGWTPEEMAYALREDDFLFLKLGSHKPKCNPVRMVARDAAILEREQAIARVTGQLFSSLDTHHEPLFAFVDELSLPRAAKIATSKQNIPRFCYSYFALYGDPLLDKRLDPYPDGYLARLAELGVNGIWLQAVLYKLAAFPWQPGLSDGRETRLKNLRSLVARSRRYGIGVYLYLNEPRSMPLAFFEQHPELKGATEGDHAALCTSNIEVRQYLTGAVESICRNVPGLGGFFTITASENLTNCWSHSGGANCPRCGNRSPAEVIAEVNTAVSDGILKNADGSGDARPDFIVWDWGWQDSWAEGIINRLPGDAALMSVSEWDLPINRGGVASRVGEYSISAVGPGPRATRHWEMARKRGLKIMAKIQASNTWELSAVPYIPALENVARHAANLRGHNVDGLMLGWTLGGYPSPNLEVVARILDQPDISPEAAMLAVAAKRFGDDAGAHVVNAWQAFSKSFSQFPFHVGAAYSAPLQVGPANLLWAKATGYRASMVGFPYDDVDTWRSIYPATTFAELLDQIGRDFEAAIAALKAGTAHATRTAPALDREMNVAEASAIHFQSVANQTRFVLARHALDSAKNHDEAQPQIDALAALLEREIVLATRLFKLQARDSRIGFEASNQYYYVPLDLAEKVLNCRDLLNRWLPEQRRRF